MKLISTFLSSAALAALVTLPACSATVADEAEAQSTSQSSAALAVSATPIVFDTAWNETPQGRLVEGGALAIDYDPARLPQCRASHNGNPGWNITGFARFLPSGTQAQADIMAHAASSSGPPDYSSWIRTIPVVSIPPGTTEVEMWFMNGSSFDRPCTAWDSNHSANYRFTVAPRPREASLSFGRDWSRTTDGTLTRGAPLTIQYDTERLMNRREIFGGPGWLCREELVSIAMHVRFSAQGAFQTIALDNVSQRGQFVGITSTTVTIPTDASRVEAYFVADLGYTWWNCAGASTPSRDASGRPIDPPVAAKTTVTKPVYDSNYGANFVYAIP